jgi:Methyltransferase domain.
MQLKTTEAYWDERAKTWGSLPESCLKPTTQEVDHLLEYWWGDKRYLVLGATTELLHHDQAIGVDQSIDMLDYAYANVKESAILVPSSWHNMPLEDRCVSHIAACGSLNVVNYLEYPSIFNECHRVLDDKGSMSIRFYSRSAVYINKLRKFERMIEGLDPVTRSFEVSKLYEQDNSFVEYKNGQSVFYSFPTLDDLILLAHDHGFSHATTKGTHLPRVNFPILTFIKR